MEVSIIIVNYNTKEMTAKCIDSVFEKTKNVGFEVILVDNGSTDGSKELFEQDSRITYVYTNENLGFGKANNLGYSYASGNFIFLLNSDTLLVNNAIFEMLQFMKNASSSIGCCGGILLNQEMKRIFSYYKNFPTLWWIFQENLLFAVPKSRLFWNPYVRYQEQSFNDEFPLFVKHISGADLFIRRAVIEKCGMFDPEFFMYYEETEMQFRFEKNGFKSVIIDTPKIIHLCGASSTKGFNLKKMNMNLKSRFIYARKTFSFSKRVVFRLIHLILVPRLLFSRNLWADKKETLKIIFKV